MELIGIIMLCFFALIGVGCFISALCGCQDAEEHAALMLDQLKAGDAEMRVRAAAKLCDRIRCQRLICICVDEGAQQICDRLSTEYRIIEIRQSG